MNMHQTIYVNIYESKNSTKEKYESAMVNWTKFIRIHTIISTIIQAQCKFYRSVWINMAIYTNDVSVRFIPFHSILVWMKSEYRFCIVIVIVDGVNKYINIFLLYMHFVGSHFNFSSLSPSLHWWWLRIDFDSLSIARSI